MINCSGMDRVNYTQDVGRHGLHMNALDIAYVSVTAVMSLMSILGCLLLLVVHWVYNDLRTAGRNMLVHLTVADLLTALGNLMGVTWYLNVETMNNKMAYCKLHSALTIMSSIASFMWTVVIAWFVFWIVVRKQPSPDQRQRRCSHVVLSVVCWGVPALIALVAMLNNVLGYDQNLAQASWCWIDPTTDYPLLWMLITGKAWEVAACIGTVSLYTAVKVMLLRQAHKQKTVLNHHSRKLEQANTKLTFVPLVFVVMRVWGSIRFLLGNFAHEYASSSEADWIVIMQGAGDSAQGITNCVIYCFFTAKIRHRLLRSCHCLIWGQPKSSGKDSSSSQRLPQIRHGMSAGRGSNMRNSNKVVPVPVGPSKCPNSHFEENKSNIATFQQEQVLDNLHPQKEHLQEQQQQKHQEQPLTASVLTEHHMISQKEQTAAISQVVEQNNISNRYQHDIGETFLHNELESSGKLFPIINSVGVSVNDSSVSREQLCMQEQIKSVWTTSVSNVCSHATTSTLVSNSEAQSS